MKIKFFAIISLSLLMIFACISCDDNMDNLITEEINASQENNNPSGENVEPSDEDDEHPGNWELLKKTGIALKNAASAEYNGWLYIHGGENPLGTANTFWRINLTSGTIESLGEDIFLSSHEMVVIDGLLYLFGGRDGNGYAVNTFRTYDLDNIGELRWIREIAVSDTNGPFPLARYGHRTFTYNGYFFVYGGIEDSGIFDNVIYRFDPLDTPKPRWIKLNTEGPARAGAGVVVYDDKLFVFGGLQSTISVGNTFRKELWCYDFVLDQWSSLAAPEEAAPGAWMRLSLSGDCIVSLWGENATGTSDDSFCYYQTGVWELLNIGPDSRSFYSMNSWAGNTVVYGGYNSKTSLYYDDIWILTMD